MKKTRSFLTMLGIIIGVASVVIVMVSRGPGPEPADHGDATMKAWATNKITVQRLRLTTAPTMRPPRTLYDYCLNL
ncbi:MAG: hypothetical protein ACLR0P_14220 [Oscillospiraceae bacterium]